MQQNFPSKGEAETLLSWAGRQNPGSWTDHSRVVARAAEHIASKCGLDTEKAYVSGLLHDIGYFECRNGTERHIYAGYAFMKEKGYDASARICLSHSFPIQDIRAYSGGMNCPDEELKTVVSFLMEATYDEYDKLIQLCDCLGLPQGVCLLEQRMTDVAIRHGFNDFTIRKWQSYYALKYEFDKMCGLNIYTLFYDELICRVFGPLATALPPGLRFRSGRAANLKRLNFGETDRYFLL